MDKIIAQYWHVCALRAGPQDVPASPFLALMTCALYMMISTLFYTNRLPFPSAVFAGLVDFALLAGLLYLVLWVRLMVNRWLQTITALAGSGVILTVIGLFIEIGLQSMPAQSSGAVLFGLLGIAQLGWSVVVLTHILRHALSAHLLLAAAFTAVYVYVALNVMNALFFVTPE